MSETKMPIDEFLSEYAMAQDMAEACKDDKGVLGALARQYVSISHECGERAKERDGYARQVRALREEMALDSPPEEDRGDTGS